MKPLIVASTRPEIIKLSPIILEFDRRGLDYTFVTTGQHYDRLLFKKFIEDLGLRIPDHDIKVGSGSHAYQTSFAMEELEKTMLKIKPDVVIVEGDTNSVLSSALTAVKLKIPVAHVEAGLRSFDKTMPEEINRIIADHCSSVLFAPTEISALNLVNEGLHPKNIFVVGNTIVDATLRNIEIAVRKSAINKKFPRDYILLTLHRAENVDHLDRLKGIAEALVRIEESIVFPIHPRTKKMLEKFNLLRKLEKKKIFLIGPLGYLDFLVLMKNARAIITDSGGIQEEAIVLNIPCITVRQNTERPETIDAGGNILAGVDAESIKEKVNLVLKDKKVYESMKKAKNPFGKGDTGIRIVEILENLHNRKKLKIQTSDLTKGLLRRAFIKVDSEMAGREIGDLDLTVLKIIDGSVERFPRKEYKLKKGQIIEVVESKGVDLINTI